MNGNPVGLERWHELAGRGVDDHDVDREREHNGQQHEQAEVVRAEADRSQYQHQHRRAREGRDELVHVAPGHAVLGHSPGRVRGDLQGSASAGQQERDAQPRPLRPRRPPCASDCGLAQATAPGPEPALAAARGAVACRPAPRAAAGEVRQLRRVGRIGGKRVPGLLGTGRSADERDSFDQLWPLLRGRGRGCPPFPEGEVTRISQHGYGIEHDGQDQRDIADLRQSGVGHCRSLSLCPGLRHLAAGLPGGRGAAADLQHDLAR